jgi:phage tail-like protein
MAESANPSYLYKIEDVSNNSKIAEFEELTGGEMKIAVMPYTCADSNGVSVTKYIPGITSYAPITLVHALNVEGQALSDWLKQVIQGKVKDARKHILISMLDSQAKAIVTWDLINAIPTGISGFSFNQHTKGGLYYVCQELTLQVEYIEMKFQ